MSWFCLCNRSTGRPLSTTKDVKFVRVRNQNIGWFFPCEACDTPTSNEISYMIMLRKDVDQIKFFVCNRCKSNFHLDHLHPLYHVKKNPHLELRFCTPRVRSRKVC